MAKSIEISVSHSHIQTLTDTKRKAYFPSLPSASCILTLQRESLRLTLGLFPKAA